MHLEQNYLIFLALLIVLQGDIMKNIKDILPEVRKKRQFRHEEDSIGEPINHLLSMLTGFNTMIHGINLESEDHNRTLFDYRSQIAICINDFDREIARQSIVMNKSIHDVITEISDPDTPRIKGVCEWVNNASSLAVKVMTFLLAVINDKYMEAKIISYLH